jgi:hypothetical protein
MTTPRKQPPTVTLTVLGGAVQEAEFSPGLSCRVVIRDYDVEGVEESKLHTDDEGIMYYEMVFWPDEENEQSQSHKEE